MESTVTTPAQLGYRMPAEWEPHEATWLSWPHREGISFPDAYHTILPIIAKMVDALADSEPVHINVRDAVEVTVAAEQRRAVAPRDRRDHAIDHSTRGDA